MYLESSTAGRLIYAHFGYQAVEGEGQGFVMIRNPPAGVKPLEKVSPKNGGDSEMT